jgi:hypothetical protein
MRLISSTCVPSDPTLNIWRSDVDRCAPGRGKRWDSSLWTHGIMDLRWEVPDEHAVPVRNVVIHSGTRRWSWAPVSTLRRVMHDDDLEHLPYEQEARCTTTIDFEFPQSLKNSTTTFRAAVMQPTTTYSINGLTRPPIGTSSTTTQSSGLALTEIEQWSLKNKQSRSDQFLQQVFNDQQIYDDKIRLLFIKSYSTSVDTLAHSDRRGEPVGQIEPHAPELVCVEWSTSNVPPPHKKLIQA